MGMYMYVWTGRRTDAGSVRPSVGRLETTPTTHLLAPTIESHPPGKVWKEEAVPCAMQPFRRKLLYSYIHGTWTKSHFLRCFGCVCVREREIERARTKTRKGVKDEEGSFRCWLSPSSRIKKRLHGLTGWCWWCWCWMVLDGGGQSQSKQLGRSHTCMKGWMDGWRRGRRTIATHFFDMYYCGAARIWLCFLATSHNAVHVRLEGGKEWGKKWIGTLRSTGCEQKYKTSWAKRRTCKVKLKTLTKCELQWGPNRKYNKYPWQNFV